MGASPCETWHGAALGASVFIRASASDEGANTPDTRPARTSRNARPIIRPDNVLLLQSWSTAISQATNSSGAAMATALSHIGLSPIVSAKKRATGSRLRKDTSHTQG